MSTACVDTATAAGWRRQRRLRPWLRHERMTVAMTLAEATHHTAPRGQKTARAQEEVEREAEPVPQLRFEAAARASVVDGLPTFALPVLAGSAGEAIDSGSLSFLVRQTLLERDKEKRKEEEEKDVAKHMAVQSEAAETMQRARLLLEQAGKRRKRKKRRKKKLPKASSSRSSCASHAARTRISGRSSTRPLYLAVLFGVMVFPEEYFGVFPYSAIPWFYNGYSTCVSRRCFW